MRNFLDVGIARRGKWLLYGYKHGFGRFLPVWILNSVVTILNFIACRIWEHEFIAELADNDSWPPEFTEYDVCINCCKRKLR